MIVNQQEGATLQEESKIKVIRESGRVMGSRHSHIYACNHIGVHEEIPRARALCSTLDNIVHTHRSMLYFTTL